MFLIIHINQIVNTPARSRTTTAKRSPACAGPHPFGAFADGAFRSFANPPVAAGRRCGGAPRGRAGLRRLLAAEIAQRPGRWVGLGDFQWRAGNACLGRPDRNRQIAPHRNAPRFGRGPTSDLRVAYPNATVIHPWICSAVETTQPRIQVNEKASRRVIPSQRFSVTAPVSPGSGSPQVPSIQGYSQTLVLLFAFPIADYQGARSYP